MATTTSKKSTKSTKNGTPPQSNSKRAVADVLSEIKHRHARHLGIGLASDYVSTIGSCFGRAGAEPYFGMGTNAKWAQALRESKQTLIYRDDSMDVLDAVRNKPSSLSRSAKQRRRQQVNKLTSQNPRRRKQDDEKDDSSDGFTKGAVMEFDCVLTSVSRDRDRDILEPSGARIDSKMPLLWQHIPMQPIGKLLKIVDRDDEVITARFAIVNSALGRDAARLTEFGALRISHAFVPTEFDPIEEEGESDGPPLMTGWHVREYDMLEGSLVSIPSNTDAVVTAFSREKLHHPLIKSWAQGLYEGRPPLVRSGWTSGDHHMPQAPSVNVTVNIDKEGLDTKSKKNEGRRKEEDVPDPETEEQESGSLEDLHDCLQAILDSDDIDEVKELTQEAIDIVEAMQEAQSEETGEDETDEEGKEKEEGEEDEDEEEDEKEEEPEETAEEEGEEKEEGEEDETDEEGKEGEDEEPEEEEEKEQAEGEDDVEPGDSEGREDEDEEEMFDPADEGKKPRDDVVLLSAGGGKKRSVLDDILDERIAHHAKDGTKKTTTTKSKSTSGKTKKAGKTKGGRK